MHKVERGCKNSECSNPRAEKGQDDGCHPVIETPSRLKHILYICECDFDYTELQPFYTFIIRNFTKYFK